jgi:hypothetical protein
VFERTEYDKVIGTPIPHADFGDPQCCGCLCGVVQGDQAKIICNECEKVLRTVPASELQNTLDHMQLTLDAAAAMCPHCRAVNVFPGLTKVAASVCRDCGKGVWLDAQA